MLKCIHVVVQHNILTFKPIKTKKTEKYILIKTDFLRKREKQMLIKKKKLLQYGGNNSTFCGI